MNFAPYRKVPSKSIEMIDLFVFNEVEASAFFKSGIKNPSDAIGLSRARTDMNGKVVITLGENGAVIFDSNGPLHIKGIQAYAVGSTGAGDSFVGALVHELSGGSDLSGAADRANRVAALSVTRMGAMPSLPFAGEI